MLRHIVDYTFYGWKRAMKHSYLSDGHDGAVLPAAGLQKEPSKVQTNTSAVLLFKLQTLSLFTILLDWTGKLVNTEEVDKPLRLKVLTAPPPPRSHQFPFTWPPGFSALAQVCTQRETAGSNVQVAVKEERNTGNDCR